MIQSRLFIVILAILCLGNWEMQSIGLAQPQAQSQTTSQSEEYFTGDDVPGDPVNEVSIMHRIYEFVQIYRQRYEGRYPTGDGDQGSLLRDMMRNLQVYGFANFSEYKNHQVNPDNKYADNIFIRRNPSKYTMSTFPHLRLNGAELGSPKPEGTRDILSVSNIYQHNNFPFSQGLRQNANPVGFYVVLWDDGEVQKVPYDEVYIALSSSPYQYAYPGQAGVPWNCLTYSEYMMGIMLAQTPIKTPLIGYPLSPGQIEPKPDNGGIESLVQLTRLFGHNLRREPIWDSLGHQVKDFTLQEVADGAAKIDFPLKKKTITLDELQKLHTPAILYLSDAARIVTMSTIDDNHAIIYDRGMTLNVSRAELAKRYSGEALIAASVNAPSSLTADQPIRTLDFSSKDAEVVQTAKITNNGNKPISLLIERPLCGITDAKLSQDKLAPGESANLELHFKWRMVLPGDHQSTFVTLKTDDPAQPRLQMGFDLKLAESK